MTQSTSFAFLFKRSVVIATAVAVVSLLAFAAYFQLAKAAAGNVTVVTQPSDSEFRPIVGHKASAVFATTKFGLKDSDGPDDSLKSVAFTVTAGSPAVIANDFSYVAIYKDNGDGIFAAATDTRLATTTPNIGSATTITVNNALATSTATYYVVAALSASASNGSKFTVDMASNGLTDGADNAITTNALTGMTSHLVDTVAPTINTNQTFPANNSSGVPLESFPHVSFTDASGEMDFSTLNSTNISFTKSVGGTPTAVPFSLKVFPDGFDVIPSSAPTWVTGTVWSKPYNISNCFAGFEYNQSVNFDCSATFSVGDIVLFQNENFPPELGIVTNATKTGGTFSVNGFPLFGPQRLIKFPSPTATGDATDATNVKKGDVFVTKTTANPSTNSRYDWTLVTTAAAVNNAALRLNGAGAAPTFDSGAKFSTLTPTASSTDNGSTADGTLTVIVGDLVFAKVNADGLYKWHIATTAGDLSSDGTEGTAGLDGNNAAASLLEANSVMSKLTPVATGAVTDATSLSNGDIIFADGSAGVANPNVYSFHFVSTAGAVNGAGLRVDNVPSSLTSSSTYTTTIGPNVADSAGNLLGATTTISFTTSSFDGGNVVMPPMVFSTSPSGGSESFSPNANLYVEFPKGDAGNMLADGTTNAVNNAGNILLQLESVGQPTGSNLCASSGCTLAFSTTTRRLKVDPATDLATGTKYVLTIKSNIKNQAGQSLMPPDMLVFFKTASAVDSTAPTFSGMDPLTDSTGVVRNLPSVRVGFSEAIDQSTINENTVILWEDSNGDGVKDIGETPLTVSRQYRDFEKSLELGVQQLLAQNTKYCVAVTTGVKDVAGNAVASNASKCFTSANTAYSAVAPKLSYADANTFNLWIEFDQPVDFTSGPFGATNKQNYSIESPIGTKLSLNNASFAARPEARAVEVTGLALKPGDQFKVAVTNVKEISGTTSVTADGTDNVAKGTVLDASAAGGGFIGGFDTQSFDQKDFGDFWTKPERAEPNLRMVGKTADWMVEFPTPAALATGSKITLTFPSGFNVASAAARSATESFFNQDLNGFGPGVTTISALATSTAARTVTVTLAHSGTAMLSGDQLRFELKNIVNADTEGEKTVTAIVKDATGVKVGQTISFAPFGLIAAGSRSVAGTVCKSTTSGGTCGIGDTGIQGVKVFLDSFRGLGRQEATTDSSGDYSFTSLTDGEYGIGMFMDMGQTALADLGGGGQFKQIAVSGSNLADIDFKMVDLATTGKTLTVSVTGGPASKDFDVFCDASSYDFQFSAPVVKKGTFDGSGAATVTLKVQPNTTYTCNLGPHFEFTSFSTGGPPPIPDFDFMPPKPQIVNVANADLSVSFALTTTSEQIVGKVVDGSGNGIANVYIDAFPAGGKTFDSTTGGLQDMSGSFSQTKSDGTFILKLTLGTYGVGACAPGMPCSPPVTVDVKANSSGTDGNTTADVYKDGNLLTGTGLTIKLGKSNVTIAGAVKDESSNAISYGFVDAQQVSSATDTCSNFTNKGGFMGSPTDKNGNYTLYVPSSIESSTTYWRVSAFSPSYGEVACKVITVAGASLTGQTLQATAADYGQIKITATKGGSATEGAFAGCFSSSGGNHGKTGTDGTVTLRVKTGTYTCDGYIPGAGPLAQQTDISVTSGQTTNVTLAVGNPGTVAIDLGSTITDAFCSVVDTTTGRGDHTGANSNGVYSLNVPAGTYTASCNNPRIGQVFSENVTVTAGETNSLDKTASAPTLYTVSGRVADSSDNNLSGTTVTFTDQTNGRKAFIPSSGASGSSDNVSITLPAGTYSVQSLKSGYADSALPQVLVVAADATMTTRTLAQASASNVSVTVQESSANYGGQAVVVATRASDGKVVFKESDNTVSSGSNVSLSLPAGTWTVEAKGDNGKEAGTTATVVVNSSGVADDSPTLALNTAITGFTQKDKTNMPFVPSNGGTIKDQNITGLEVQLPVIDKDDTTSGTLSIAQNPAKAVDTSAAKVLGSVAYDITPKSSGGQELHDASGVVTIPITDTELTDANITLAQALVGKLNDVGDWETLPTTYVTATGTDAGTASNPHKLVANTTSFSTFAPITAADDAPSTPAGLTATAASGKQVNLSWTETSGATSYDIYQSTTSGGSFARLGSEPTVSSGSTTSYSDTGLSANTLYYYKISALNNSGESAASSEVSVRTKQEGGASAGGGSVVASGPVTTTATTLETITEEAPVVTAEAKANAIAAAKTVLTTVAAAAPATYGTMTIAAFTLEVKSVTSAIADLMTDSAELAASKPTAVAAIRNLLIGAIQLTLQKAQERLVQLLQN